MASTLPPPPPLSISSRIFNPNNLFQSNIFTNFADK